MRRVVIEAGATPDEKERGQWLKLTHEELQAVRFAVAHRRFSYPEPAHDSVLQKIDEAQVLG